MLRMLLPLLAFPTAVSAELAPARIDVFVTSTIELVGINRLRKELPHTHIAVHTVDGIEKVKAMLSRDLPGHAEAARRMALERMKHLGSDDYEGLETSAESLLLARQLGVERYPAAVFDRQWVVYGLPDLAQAYALFQEQASKDNR